MNHKSDYIAAPETTSQAAQLQEFIHAVSYYSSQEAQLQNIQDEVERAQAAGQVQLARALQDSEDTQTSIEVLAMEDLAARAKLLKANGTLDRFLTYAVAQEDHDKAFKLARKQLARAPMPTIAWREIERICLPSYFINQAVLGATRPLRLAGPEIAKRLERHVEQHSDKTDLGWWTRWRLALSTWLLQAPGNEPEPTTETPHTASASPSAADGWPVSHSEIPMPSWAPSTVPHSNAANEPQNRSSSPPETPDRTSQEARSHGLQPPIDIGATRPSQCPLISPVQTGIAREES